MRLMSADRLLLPMAVDDFYEFTRPSSSKRFMREVFAIVSPPFENLLFLSAVEKSLPTDCGTPTFFANAGL